VAGLLLALLAIVLSGPLPSALSRSRWPRRVPRAALVLWQAVALAAVLAAIGSVLATPEGLLRHLSGHGEIGLGAGVVVAAGIAVVLAATIVLRLGVVVIRLGLGTRRRRQRQRDMLDLLQTASPADLHLHVLSGDVPLAYCVPGRQPKVVVSAATLNLLSPDETAAVVAHERAHLRARHDLVLEAFTALHVAFPRFVRSKAALDAVNQLLEMLADDEAARRVGPARLHQALEKLSHTAGTEGVTARSQRLQSSSTSTAQVSARLLSTAAYSGAVAVLAVPTITVVSPWLTGALAAAGFSL